MLLYLILSIIQLSSAVDDCTSTVIVKTSIFLSSPSSTPSRTPWTSLRTLYWKSTVIASGLVRRTSTTWASTSFHGCHKVVQQSHFNKSPRTHSAKNTNISTKYKSLDKPSRVAKNLSIYKKTDISTISKISCSRHSKVTTSTVSKKAQHRN